MNFLTLLAFLLSSNIPNLGAIQQNCHSDKDNYVAYVCNWEWNSLEERCSCLSFPLKKFQCEL